MANFNFIPPVAFHPGETLSEKLKEMGMSVQEFALRTAKSEDVIMDVIKGYQSVTADLAESFEQVTHIPAHFWLKKQQSYDEYISRRLKSQIVHTKDSQSAVEV